MAIKLSDKKQSSTTIKHDECHDSESQNPPTGHQAWEIVPRPTCLQPEGAETGGHEVHANFDPYFSFNLFLWPLRAFRRRAHPIFAALASAKCEKETRLTISMGR